MASDPGHYFDVAPTARHRPRHVRLTLPDTSLELATDSGVFARDGVDPGTKLLLLEGGRPPDGAVDVVDVGCGYGPIALTLARRNPGARVWAVDVNERALDLCRANAAANDVANVEVVTPDAMPSEVRVAEVWSNPPVRIGKPALHELLMTWLGRLDDGGRAVLVVHKHLGADSLARWLESKRWTTQRVASRSGYRVLEVRR